MCISIQSLTHIWGGTKAQAQYFTNTFTTNFPNTFTNSFTNTVFLQVSVQWRSLVKLIIDRDTTTPLENAMDSLSKVLLLSHRFWATKRSCIFNIYDYLGAT